MPDIENPMVLGEPDYDKPIGKCEICEQVIYHGDGAVTYDDELFCSPCCLWDYLKSEKIIEEI